MTELFMLTRGLDHALPLDVTGWQAPDAPWFKRTAHRCIMLGDYKAIANRKTGELYLVRFWLSDPNTYAVNEDIESGNSLMLHLILAPDEDPSLHDHPWPFESIILSGGYAEMLPPVTPWPYIHGPDDGKTIYQNVGSVIRHEAGDLHRIDYVAPDTWSMVRTGKRVRDWGFHPANSRWEAWADKRRQRVHLDPGG